jgi:hypothetical protein
MGQMKVKFCFNNIKGVKITLTESATVATKYNLYHWLKRLIEDLKPDDFVFAYLHDEKRKRSCNVNEETRLSTLRDRYLKYID